MSWKKTFFFSFVAQVIGILGFSFATPFLPFFVAELGVEDSGLQAFWAGIVLSAAGFSFAFFAPIWGHFADRYGRKLMVCRAMFGGSLALLLISFSRNVPQLVVFRLFQGAFSGTLAASIALVASVVPQHRSGLALGMMQTAVFIGHAVGPFFGGLAADMFGYRASFRAGALITLLGGLLVYLGVDEEFKPPPSGRPPAGAEHQGFVKILLLPGFLISVVVLFAVRFSNTMMNPSFPLIVRDVVKTQENLNSVTGFVLAAAAVAAAFSAAVLGHAGDRLGRRRVLIGCCAGAAIASVGHFFVMRVSSLFAVRVLFGLMVAGMLPAANAMIHSVVNPRAVGKAYGLATSLSMLGAALGPGIGGFVAMKAGLRVPFLIAGAAHLCLALLALMFFHERRAGATDAAPG